MTRIEKKTRAAIFVYMVRPLIPGKLGSVRDCPLCGHLLVKYEEGWLHVGDGDADCYGALSYGKE